MAQSIGLNRKRQVPAEDTPAFGAIAERFRRAGDLERAIALCQEGLVKFPNHLSARVTLGWSLLDLGRYDEAREALEQALKRAPDNLAAIRGLAELHDRAEHTMLVPMDGPGQWPPDPSAVDGLEVDPAASTAPAGVPLKPEPLSLDSLLSGTKPKADALVDVVMPAISVESGPIPDLIQSTSHRSPKAPEPKAHAVVAAPAATDEAAEVDLSAVLGEVAGAVPDIAVDDTGVELSADDADLEKALQVAQAAAEQAAADAAATRKAAEEQSAAEGRARKAAEDKAAEEGKARKAAEEKAAAETAARKAAEEKAAAETAARKAAEQAAAEAAARHAAEQKAAAEAASRKAAEEKAAADAAAKKAADEKAAAEAAAKKAAETAAAEAASTRAAEQKAAREAAEKAAAEAKARKAAEEKAAAETAARKAAEERAAAETAARQAAEKAAAEAARKAAEDRAAAEAAAKQAAEERAAMEAERRRAAQEKAEAEAAARRAAEEKAEAEAAARLAAKTAAAEAEARRAAEQRVAAEATARAAAEEAAQNARHIEIRAVPETGPVVHALNGTDAVNGTIEVTQPGAVLNLSTPDPGQSARTRRGSARRSLPELEKLLRRVESRRAQLMTESVA